jgi:hypothetical protein
MKVISFGINSEMSFLNTALSLLLQPHCMKWTPAHSRDSVVILAVLFAVAQGCAETQNPIAGLDQTESSRLPSKTLADAQRKAMEASVVCSSESDCPEPMGMIIAASSSGVGFCSGFLLSADTAMTSIQCVPEDLRFDGAFCVDRIRMLFPTTANLAESHAECSRVLKYSDGKTDPAAAYAILQLDRSVMRGHFPVGVGGLVDGMNVMVSRVRLISDTHPFGEISSERCRVAQGSAVFPGFDHPEAPVGVIADCKISFNAFGAPVVNTEDGTVRALVTRAFEGRDRMQVHFKDLLRSRVTDFGYVANLACITTTLADGGESTMPRACTDPSRPVAAPVMDVDQVRRPMFTRVQKEVGLAFDEWSARNSEVFRWEKSGLLPDLSGTLRPLPACLNKPEAWLSKYKKPWYLIGDYKTGAKLDFKIPQWKVSFEMNSYLQVVYSVTAVPPVDAVAMFNPKDVFSKGASRVILHNAASLPVTWLDATLEKCK